MYSIQIQINSPKNSEIYVRTLQVRNDKGWFIENVVLIIFALLAGSIGYIKTANGTYSKDGSIRMFYLCVLTVIVSYPLFSNGIFRGADFSFHASRIEGIFYSLKGGQLPVRIHETVFSGYGHAASIFYPELFLYIPAVLMLFGISLVTSIQIFLFLINFMSVYNIYIAVKRMFQSEDAGLFAAVLYASAPYRLMNMYFRFALGETLAMCFLPLVIYGLYEVCEGNAKKWIWLAIGFSGVLQSHIITTLFTGIICLLFLCMYGRNLKKERIKAIVFSGALTVLLNLWFLVPLLQYMSYGKINTQRLQKEDLSLFTVHLSQIFQIGMIQGSGTGGVSVGRSLSTALPLRLGAPIWLSILIGLPYRLKKKEAHSFIFPIYAVILGGIFLWASTYLFPWDWIVTVPILGKIFQYIQFPYRLLSYATVLLCFFCAEVFIKTVQEKRKLYFIVIGMSAFFLAGSFFESFMLQDWIIYRGEASNGYAVSQGEYLLCGTNVNEIFMRGAKTTASSDRIIITKYEKQGTNIYLTYVNKTSHNERKDDSWIEVPLHYYPNYAAKLENRPLEIVPGENNVLRIKLPLHQSGKIDVCFHIPVLWHIAEGISALAVFLCIGILWKNKRKNAKITVIAEKKNKE